MERSFEYQDEDYNVRITVRRATVEDGITRQLLVQSSNEKPGPELSEVETARFWSRLLLRNNSYPVCVSVLSKVENLEPPALKQLSALVPFDEYRGLPETLTEMWYTEAIRLNPHWAPEPPKVSDARGGVQEPAASST